MAAARNSPAYGARNVQIVAAGTGEALPGPTTCGNVVVGAWRPITDDLGKWTTGRTGVGGGHSTDMLIRFPPLGTHGTCPAPEGSLDRRRGAPRVPVSERTTLSEVFSTDWSFGGGQDECRFGDGADSLRAQSDAVERRPAGLE